MDPVFVNKMASSIRHYSAFTTSSLSLQVVGLSLNHTLPYSTCTGHGRNGGTMHCGYILSQSPDTDLLTSE